MILVLGTIDEAVTAHFLAHLVATDQPFAFVDERQLGDAVRIELGVCGDPARPLDAIDDIPGVTPRGPSDAIADVISCHMPSDGMPDAPPRLTGRVCFPRWHADLAEITGIYTRLGTGAATLPDTPAARAERAHAAALLDLFAGPVANRATAMWSNSSKPAQYPAIIAAGFRVPDTVIAAPWLHARPHLDRWGAPPIVKSTSGVRSLVKAIDPAALGPDPLPPHQLQRRIHGDNIRVHLVGGHTALASRAVTDAIDYRHPGLTGHDTRLEATELPPRVIDACRRLAHALDIGFAGIDLVEPPGGSPDPADWHCFEVNTCPGYLWYESNAGLPIAAALADWLCGG